MKSKSYYKRPMFFGWYSINSNNGIKQKEHDNQQLSQITVTIS